MDDRTPIYSRPSGQLHLEQVGWRRVSTLAPNQLTVTVQYDYGDSCQTRETLADYSRITVRENDNG